MSLGWARPLRSWYAICLICLRNSAIFLGNSAMGLCAVCLRQSAICLCAICLSNSAICLGGARYWASVCCLRGPAICLCDTATMVCDLRLWYSSPSAHPRCTPGTNSSYLPMLFSSYLPIHTTSISPSVSLYPPPPSLLSSYNLLWSSCSARLTSRQTLDPNP
eukprot:2034668-Rhodomonas_salina.1